MTYQHGRTNGRTFTEADRALARKRNQSLLAELHTLELHNASLVERIETAKANLAAELTVAKADLSKAREQLTKTIKEADAVRAQAAQIRAAADYLNTLPEPVHGGRAGLEAATREILEHEARKKAAGTVVTLEPRQTPTRPAKGPAHGTQACYRAGCRCLRCRARKAADAATFNRSRKQVAA